eukprot:scaffold8717_cov167-Amphora_coffeaeformis.AAC.3
MAMIGAMFWQNLREREPMFQPLPQSPRLIQHEWRMRSFLVGVDRDFFSFQRWSAKTDGDNVRHRCERRYP